MGSGCQKSHITFFIYLGAAKEGRKEKGKDTLSSRLLLREEKGRQKRAVLTHLLIVEESFQRYFPLVLHLHQGQNCLHFVALCHSEPG